MRSRNANLPLYNRHHILRNQAANTQRHKYICTTVGRLTPPMLHDRDNGCPEFQDHDNATTDHGGVHFNDQVLRDVGRLVMLCAKTKARVPRS